VRNEVACIDDTSIRLYIVSLVDGRIRLAQLEHSISIAIASSNNGRTIAVKTIKIYEHLSITSPVMLSPLSRQKIILKI